MNDPEDRPTSNNRPEPSPDPGNPSGPPRPPTESTAPFSPPPPPPPPPPPGGPPQARWEDVVDPAPAPPAAAERPPVTAPGPWPDARPARPAPARPAPAAAPAPPPGPPQAPAAAPAPPTAPTAPGPDPAPVPAGVADEDLEDDGTYDDEPVSRWVSLLATLGTALIGIVSVQVIASLIEGLTLKKGERVGVPDDLLHRLGYPFGGLGATALVFLVLGVVLVALPSVLDELLSESQDRVVGVALVVAIVMGVLVALGSLLAVRANLHEYAAKGVPVPAYVRVQFTNFLLGSLGAAALALFGAITAMNERGRERA